MAFRTERFSLPNVVSLLCMLLVVSTVWGAHVFLHLLPLLRIEAVSKAVQTSEPPKDHGIFESCISQLLFLLFFISWLRVFLVEPGAVPEEWQLSSETLIPLGNERRVTREVKAKDGKARWCKRCTCFKPDRAHHCRLCNACVLRMDHHCPWVANCIGYFNYKYFFCLVFYASLYFSFVAFGMARELLHSSDSKEMPSYERFLLVFAVTLALILAPMLQFFLSFHVHLLFSGMTTIEFCETRFKDDFQSRSDVGYSVGYLQNLYRSLGPYALLWLLPLSPPSGDGVTFHATDLRR